MICLFLSKKYTICFQKNIYEDFFKLMYTLLYFLANSKSDYVQFQAASLLKQATIREWRLMDKATIEQLRTGLLNFVIQNLKYLIYLFVHYLREIDF